MTPQDNPDQIPASQPAEAVSTPEPSSAKFSKKHLKTAALFVLLLAVVAAAYFVGRQTTGSPAALNASPAPSVTVKPSFEGKYLAAAQPLNPAPNFFADYRKLFGEDCNGISNAQPDDPRCPDQVKPSQVKYFRLGTTQAGQTVILADPGLEGMDAQRFVALQTGDNQYKILGKLSSIPSDSASIASFAAALSKTTTLDATADLPDFKLPASFSFKGLTYAASYVPTDGSYLGYPLENGLKDIRGYGYASGPYKSLQKLGTTGAYDVYEVTVQTGSSFAVNEIYLAVKGVYAGSYALSSVAKYSTDTPPAISWSDGSKNTASFSPQPPGCGSASGYIVVTGLNASQLTSIGTGPDGQTLYQLPTNSPLFQKMYQEDYAGGQYVDDPSLKNLTADQAQAKHLAFIQKAGSELVVYLNRTLIAGGGCAKPVVYLYPTSTEQVSVAVGAKVTNSDPLYTAHGWRGVLASPGGLLTVGGKTYPSLFWEGTGLGEYPILTTGTVVPASAAVATIRRQLAEQGLNAREINDFVNYWQPKLPKTPYVRLSWLTKGEIDELAPLTITPRPDTVIRVFLDFQGLNQPVQMPAPHFTAPVRRGFTAVEWGGLNRSR